jgi:alkaline phosphatase D
MDIRDQNTPLSRRGFLAVTGLTTAAIAGIAGLDPALRRGLRAAPASTDSADPFTLGVASGDPDHRSVVLWTRLAPDPLDPAALGDRTVPVEWEVYADERLRRRVARGLAHARPADGHSVHVEVGALRPDHWYWYRFRAGRHVSPVGRTRTCPAPGRATDRLRFAIVSCQHYEQGLYTAYRHLAADDLDLVMHTGDYIYEGAATTNPDAVRRHDGPEVGDLTSYRNRHALYRTDPDLQAAHAAFPFVVTWDDHEVENNYAGAISQDEIPAEEFLDRRANAYKAYWEHMPLRASQRPDGADMRLYRRFTYGDLAGVSVLDTRQYRSNQACGDGTDDVPCGDWDDPARTLMGAEQEAWLLDGLGRSRARWNVISQQVFMAERDFLVGEGRRLSMDGWDGYPAARQRLIGGMIDRGVRNLVVLTGDVHRHYAADLKADFADPDSPTIGSELVCTSISSGGDGSDDTQDALRAESPHVHYSRQRRGYVRTTLDRRSMRADFLTLPYVTRPGAPIAVDASFTVEAGNPGLQAS